MPFRLGVDLDGTLADLSSAYHELERRLYGEASADVEADETSVDADDKAAGNIRPGNQAKDSTARVKAAKQANVRRSQVWRALRATENFWMTLQPIEPDAIKRLSDVVRRYQWEVVFITQRPSTAGETVQRQSQAWLAAHGFDMPSVITIDGSRGRAAAALELDVLIDDLPKNCVDVTSDSRCRALLVTRTPDTTTDAAARRLKIGVVRSVSEAIDLLVATVAAKPQSGVMERVRRALGLSL